jgi:hypothetical protein
MAPSQTSVIKTGNRSLPTDTDLRDDDSPSPSRRAKSGFTASANLGTFGEGVASEETYSQVLEKLLHARFSQIEFQVINAGVSSYTSYQG